MGALNGIQAILLSVFPERWPVPLPVSAVAVMLVTIVINSWVVYDRAKDFVFDNELLQRGLCSESVFDYIVVGGGTAGMVVSTRLANASADATVLLLEAGGEPSLLNRIPNLDFFLLNQPANSFVYNTTPLKYSCGHCDDRKSLTTRAKMLGGSSSSNFMMWVRGHREDFNRWSVEDAGGDPQWSYENLLPYFRKSEDYNGAYSGSPDSRRYHGRGGLLNIASPDYTPGGDDFVAAAFEKGYYIGDYNVADGEVFSPIDSTTQNGWRESTYRAFYRDTGKPPNLCIKKYAQVTQVKFSQTPSENPRAVGVSYIRHKKLRAAYARKEVILSAGVFETPKLLLLSGVGPKYDLEAINIPVVKDLPVGKTLQDHPYILTGPFMASPALNPNRDITLRAVAQFLLRGGGPIAAPAGLAGVGLLQSPVAQPPYPDLLAIQFSVALYPELPRDVNRFVGIKESILHQWLHPYHTLNIDARFIVLYLGRPKSVGSLRLASLDPLENPILEPNYLEHPDDTEALLYGFKKIVDLYENTTSLNAPLFSKPVPGCENHIFKSDPYYRCVIRHFSGSMYHHVGTCALGKVLDNNLKVKGIEGLRVVDASVMPRTPNANTQAGVIMIAEKGADLIVHGNKYNGRSSFDEISNFIKEVS